MTILLSTLNARYAHASLGLRYLLANMGPLGPDTRIQEFVIGAKTTEVVERLLPSSRASSASASIYGTSRRPPRLVAMLKRVAPEVTIVLGGPEVSYETNEQAIVQLADYVVTGWGDVTFPKLCARDPARPAAADEGARRRAAARWPSSPALRSI